jgi:hypothetical protein
MAAGHGEGAAVCCMCGDRGLADELFRCRCCRARLQHRYCSHLYPRPAAYRQQLCSWCLRAAAAANKPEEKRETPASDEKACSPPPAELGHPVKKKRHRAEESTPGEAVAGRRKAVVGSSAGAASGGGKGEEVVRAGKTRVHRARVPRYKYKLLTDVIISC